MHNSGFFFATGPLGLAATAAVAVGRAAGNSARRREAEAATIPRWMPIDGGGIYLTGYGFYLHTARGLFRWPYRAVTMASMVDAGAVHFNADADTGPVSWVLRSDWSELLFVTWALAVHPPNPQLLTGEWLPPGWLVRASTQHRTRLSTPAIKARR